MVQPFVGFAIFFLNKYTGKRQAKETMISMLLSILPFQYRRKVRHEQMTYLLKLTRVVKERLLRWIIT